MGSVSRSIERKSANNTYLSYAITGPITSTIPRITISASLEEYYQPVSWCKKLIPYLTRRRTFIERPMHGINRQGLDLLLHGVLSTIDTRLYWTKAMNVFVVCFLS